MFRNTLIKLQVGDTDKASDMHKVKLYNKIK